MADWLIKKDVPFALFWCCRWWVMKIGFWDVWHCWSGAICWLHWLFDALSTGSNSYVFQLFNIPVYKIIFWLSFKRTSVTCSLCCVIKIYICQLDTCTPLILKKASRVIIKMFSLLVWFQLITLVSGLFACETVFYDLNGLIVCSGRLHRVLFNAKCWTWPFLELCLCTRWCLLVFIISCLLLLQSILNLSTFSG